MRTFYGLDTSRWQEQITEADVEAALAAGKVFWYFKGSGGDDGLYVDSQFQNTFDMLRKYQIRRGVYHFAGMGNGIDEANYAVDNTWSGLTTGELAILDVDTAQPGDPAFAEAFLDQATLRLGFKPVVYMNQNTENSYDWSAVVAKGYGLIIADYAVSPDGDIALKHWPFYFGQQYSSTGTVGRLSPVDLDAVFADDINAWDKYGKPSPITQPPAEISPVVSPPIVQAAPKQPIDIVKPIKKNTSMDTYINRVAKVEDKVSQNLPAITQTVDDLVKPGIKTSEWWMTLGVDITTLTGGILPAGSRWVKISSLGVMAVTTVAYILGRVHVKKAAIAATVSGQSQYGV